MKIFYPFLRTEFIFQESGLTSLLVGEAKELHLLTNFHEVTLALLEGVGRHI